MPATTTTDALAATGKQLDEATKQFATALQAHYNALCDDPATRARWQQFFGTEGKPELVDLFEEQKDLLGAMLDLRYREV